MNYNQALEINEVLRSQSPHFKDLDITAQITQLNSLTKYAENQRIGDIQDASLERLIVHRKKRLPLSIKVMCALELCFEPVISRYCE